MSVERDLLDAGIGSLPAYTLPHSDRVDYEPRYEQKDAVDGRRCSPAVCNRLQIDMAPEKVRHDEQCEQVQAAVEARKLEVGVSLRTSVTRQEATHDWR